MSTDLQGLVQDRIDRLVAGGGEVGVQVAAYVNGELVVDATAGPADRDTGRPVRPDTPFFAYSVGKGVAATVVHVLAEGKALDYDLPLADVWPEFAAHGKGGITVRHVLTHTAGVPQLPADITPADLADWDRMCAIVADSEPLWTPGTMTGYHAWTFGWLIGEVVRRVTGRTMSEVLADEVAGPLGVPDELFFAVPPKDFERLARLYDHNWTAAFGALAGALPNLGRVAPPGARPDAALANRPEILSAELPATGTVTARAMARLLAALIGEVGGVRLVSPERLREITAPIEHGPDWVFGQKSQGSLGYVVESDGVFGASGIGGSVAYACPRLGLTAVALKNNLAFGDEDPMEDLWSLVLGSVGGSS